MSTTSIASSTSATSTTPIASIASPTSTIPSTPTTPDHPASEQATAALPQPHLPLPYLSSFPLLPIPVGDTVKMTDVKSIEFSGHPSESVDQFLRGFELAFRSQEKKEGLSANSEAGLSEYKAFQILRNLKPCSEAVRFAHRLPSNTMQDFDELCAALRARFENSDEIEEERRAAEELFLSLWQKRGQSINDYVKLTKKIALGMSVENQHLVATQFVKGLDSRKLRVQIMSGLSSHPTVKEAVTKVLQVADMIDVDCGPMGADLTDLDKSEEDEDLYSLLWRGKPKKKMAGMKQKENGNNSYGTDQKISLETARIRLRSQSFF
ncbi:hypothetical protein L873DRAFT_1848039 [Choiromyces venosus 120613-1]|uniref:Retrotransposon gag domain-containing protein n=1 Tax=Choiromyces venosus 120613-1 TaxID=1336337 RepID=A0A3N4J0Z4_9PEZI|nr:hypothetical protein L873DRAFT_1848039 [Choiromyces venosus 120613-1]